MLTMGFSAEEIQDSLVNQKYNDVMAAYLLLDFRNNEVRSVLIKPTHLYLTRCNWFVRSVEAAVTLLVL